MFIQESMCYGPPMKVLILTYGSRGDVQPYVALGKGLNAGGHEVTLATSSRFQGFVRGHGLAYGHMSDALLSIIDTDQGRRLMEKTTTFFQAARQSLLMMKQLGPLQEGLLADAWAVASTFDPDVIIYHPKAYGGLLFAEKLGIPAVLALPFPLFVSTATAPCMGFPDLKLGGWYNRMTYALVGQIMALSAGRPVKKWQRAHGVAPRRFSLVVRGDKRPVPVMHGVSSHVLPRPDDWPDTAVMTGYWFLADDLGTDLPGDLRAFLDAGPPPVYIGFGSMAGRDPQKMAGIAAAALVKAGMRGILATGWGGMAPSFLPETILAIDQAPHDLLFPRTAAVVHHGGAGTTAAGLLAGKPSVIVPFFGDQPFWGHRIHRLGAGPRPIPRKNLTPDNLAVAIKTAVHDPKIAATAESLGEKIRGEDGVAAAVSFIEDLVFPP